MSNERLEFLGDAVLGLAVTDHLHRRYPDIPVGAASKIRASVVDTETLASVGVDLALGAALLLGKGEEASGGRERPSILADATEAVIGAVYLDGGWEIASAFVEGLLENRIAAAAEGPGADDTKSRLQELAARRLHAAPEYAVTDDGPDHDRVFHASVSIDGVVRGHGEGRSKKMAERGAAGAACKWLSAQERRRQGSVTTDA